MYYRDTPVRQHPATGVTPYQAMSNRDIRAKLDCTTPTEQNKRSDQEKLKDERGNLQKQKMKREGWNTKEHNFVCGDYALLKQRKHNKWSTPFEPAFYVIIEDYVECKNLECKNSSVTGRRILEKTGN